MVSVTGVVIAVGTVREFVPPQTKTPALDVIVSPSDSLVVCTDVGFGDVGKKVKVSPSAVSVEADDMPVGTETVKVPHISNPALEVTTCPLDSVDVPGVSVTTIVVPMSVFVLVLMAVVIIVSVPVLVSVEGGIRVRVTPSVIRVVVVNTVGRVTLLVPMIATPEL